MCSGCHCTPTTKCASGISMPSMMPSSGDTADTTSPSPSLAMLWWWIVFTPRRVAPTRLSSLLPSTTSTMWAGMSKGRFWTCTSPWSGYSARMSW